MNNRQLMNNHRQPTAAAAYRRALRGLAYSAGLILLGVVLGGALAPAGDARAQARKDPLSHNLRSGGQLAIPVLEEISATLQRIDARIARLETAAKQMQSQPLRPTDGLR